MAGPSEEPNIHQIQFMSHLQSFEPNPQIYNLSSNMEMIGFPSKNINIENNHHDLFQSDLLGMFDDGSTSNHDGNNRFVVEDQSLRCVFPYQENDHQIRPKSKGLSLFQSDDHLRLFGAPSSSSNSVMQDQFFVQIKNSKYLSPAKELLSEFVNLDMEKSDDKMKKVQMISDEWSDENGVRKQLFYSLDFLELQKRKNKLLQLLQEVESRYKHYCDKMKVVVQSFEAVAGNGAAKAYSSMASKAMSRHFRSLRDGIVSQIKLAKKIMGERDKTSIAQGTTKGETPRLRLLDQKLRQQRALQQMSFMESHPWRPQRGLPERSVSVLRAWLFEHFLHPYPSDVDKHILARQTGLSRSQVSNWFINARVRLWKPMVEEMYLEDLKEEDDHDHDHEANLDDENIDGQDHLEDRKPTQDQLIRLDSNDQYCLSSIIPNQAGKNDDQYGGGMQFDYSSYGRDESSTRGGGGVSLTLGLHQHGGNGGVSLAFYPRDDQIGSDYHQLDGENSQNLPYRDLMGAQLFHDFAG